MIILFRSLQVSAGRMGHQESTWLEPDVNQHFSCSPLKANAKCPTRRTSEPNCGTSGGRNKAAWAGVRRKRWMSEEKEAWPSVCLFLFESSSRKCEKPCVCTKQNHAVERKWVSRKKKKANITSTSNPVNLWTTFPFSSARSHKTQRRYSLTKDGPECGELALKQPSLGDTQVTPRTRRRTEDEEESSWILSR